MWLKELLKNTEKNMTKEKRLKKDITLKKDLDFMD